MLPGFTTLVLLINFFGGMTLLSFGLLGEYIIRIISEVTRPPRYVIRNDTTEPQDIDDFDSHPAVASYPDTAKSADTGPREFRCVPVQTGASDPPSGRS